MQCWCSRFRCSFQTSILIFLSDRRSKGWISGHGPTQSSTVTRRRLISNSLPVIPSFRQVLFVATLPYDFPSFRFTCASHKALPYMHASIKSVESRVIAAGFERVFCGVAFKSRYGNVKAVVLQYGCPRRLSSPYSLKQYTLCFIYMYHDTNISGRCKCFTLVVNLSSGSIVSFSLTHDAGTAIMSRAECNATPKREREPRAPNLLRERAGQTVPTKVSHYMWGLGGREIHGLRQSMPTAVYTEIH